MAINSRYKSRLVLIGEILLLGASLAGYSLGYLPLPIIPMTLVAWASLRLRGLRWRDVGLHRPDSWRQTIGLALLVGVGYQALDLLLIAPLLERLTGESVDLSQFSILRDNLLYFIISLFISWTLAGFLEEIFFRGYMLNRILDFTGRQSAGVAVAILGSSLVFGWAHSYQGLAGVLDTFLVGIVLGLLYLASRRNLWLPIFTHAIIDTVGFLLIYTGLYG